MVKKKLGGAVIYDNDSILKPKQLVEETKSSGLIEVGQSSLKSRRRCHAQYDYRYNQRLEKKRPAIQLIRGSMIGECIDALTAKRMGLKGVVTNFNAVLAKFSKEYKVLFDEEKDIYGNLIYEVRRIIGRYEEIYAGDKLKYPTYPALNKVPYELEVELDFIPGVIFTAHLDKYPVDGNGRHWVMDHKSHKNIPDEKARFSDLQLVFYFWAAPLMGLPKPTGVLWDYLRTKPPTIPDELKAGGLSQRQNIDTDYDTYLAEIKRLKLQTKDYTSILKTLKARGHMDFYRRVYLPGPSKALVETVVKDAKETALEIKLHGATSVVRTMAYDCPRCSYFDLCQAEARGLDSSFIRKSDFKIKPVEENLRASKEDSE